MGNMVTKDRPQKPLFEFMGSNGASYKQTKRKTLCTPDRKNVTSSMTDGVFPSTVESGSSYAPDGLDLSTQMSLLSSSERDVRSFPKDLKSSHGQIESRSSELPTRESFPKRDGTFSIDNTFQERASTRGDTSAQLKIETSSSPSDGTPSASTQNMSSASRNLMTFSTRSYNQGIKKIFLGGIRKIFPQSDFASCTINKIEEEMELNTNLGVQDEIATCSEAVEKSSSDAKFLIDNGEAAAENFKSKEEFDIETKSTTSDCECPDNTLMCDSEQDSVGSSNNHLLPETFTDVILHTDVHEEKKSFSIMPIVENNTFIYGRSSSNVGPIVRYGGVSDGSPITIEEITDETYSIDNNCIKNVTSKNLQGKVEFPNEKVEDQTFSKMLKGSSSSLFSSKKYTKEKNSPNDNSCLETASSIIFNNFVYDKEHFFESTGEKFKKENNSLSNYLSSEMESIFSNDDVLHGEYTQLENSDESKINMDKKKSSSDNANLVPIIFQWKYAALKVEIAGSFTQWELFPMYKDSESFILSWDLPVGVHVFKFHVDGQWCYNPLFEILEKGKGDIYNIIKVNESDLNAFDAINADIKKSLNFPDNVLFSQYIPPTDYNLFTPPMLPPVINRSILDNDPEPLIPDVLPKPSHVAVRHAYFYTDKNDTQVVSSTQKFRDKCITTLLYKN